MDLYFTYRLLFAYFALPGFLLGELAFRCPSCTAAHLAACPKVAAACTEIVREPGCGCCPLCARMEGEHCGVYTPRCSGGLRCYPSAETDLPLQQLIHGLGRCGQKVELDVTTSPVHQDTNEVQGTENPLPKRPPVDGWLRIAINHEQNDFNSRMRWNQPEDRRTQKTAQNPCEQELVKVLEEISRMTSQDSRGPLEDLYMLKFPNCDRDGLYNLKQCNMSNHGQRGECWCVNPSTGVQIPSTPKVRGDPNCNQFQDEILAMPTAAVSQ